MINDMLDFLILLTENESLFMLFLFFDPHFLKIRQVEEIDSLPSFSYWDMY